MLTDNLPEPHLPYTEQEGRREEWMPRLMDGLGPRSGRTILSSAVPLCYIPSLVLRCRSAEQLCQKFTPPWGSLDFPEEKEVTAPCKLQHAAGAERLAAANRGQRAARRSRAAPDLFVVLSLPLKAAVWSLKLSVSPTVPAADESCTCCARREQAQDPNPLSLSPPPPPPPSCSLRPLP